ncbi:MAG TPA: amidohydrolase family protein [Burkholderiales bacterium]|nr:amidohydrolase family protein [Burkholderiales bacterium]
MPRRDAGVGSRRIRPALGRLPSAIGGECMRTLIRCGWLVSMDEKLGALRDAELLVEDDRIAAVGRNLAARADTEIDAREMIALPGLVNAHLHTFQAAMRGFGTEWTAPEYFRHQAGNLSTRYAPEDNYLGNLLGALNQIHHGVTSVLDFCHNLKSREQAERSIDGLEESGIRAVFAMARGMDSPVTPDAAVAAGRRPLTEEALALRKGRLASDDRLVTLALAMSGPHWSIYEVCVEHARLAKELDLLLCSHATRRSAEARVPDGYDRLAAEGLLGPDHNLVHCQLLTDEELRRILQTGASITSTCMNELHDYPDFPAAGRVHALGFLPSIGVDVEVQVPADMWREAQTALRAARQEAMMKLAARGEKAVKTPVRARDALAWSTLGGARAMGLEDRIGSLTPGKKADLILLRATDLNLHPVHDPTYAIEMAHAGNVDTVMIDGVLRKQHGKLLFDQALLRRKQEALAASAARLIGEARFG